MRFTIEIKFKGDEDSCPLAKFYNIDDARFFKHFKEIQCREDILSGNVEILLVDKLKEFNY